MPGPDLLVRFALALGLGLLVGLQREWSDSRMAGIRTFPLIALVGGLAAHLGAATGASAWLLAAGLVSLTALALVGNWMKIQTRRDDAEDEFKPTSPGLTTEVAMLVVFLLGALAVLTEPLVPVVLAGTVAVLLQLKRPLHSAVDRLGDKDVRAITQFVLISCVILPLLPSRTFGPYDVLDPRQVWWMVVLIVGLGLAGYLVYKFFGKSAGTLLGGVLGGLVSSTATSVSYARRAKEQPKLSAMAAVVVTLASSVVFGRVLVEIAAVAPGDFRALAPPLAVFGAVMTALALGAWWRLRRAEGEKEETDGELDLGNPSELRSAVIFGLLYAAVLLAVAWAKDQLGPAGLYAVAVISGLTDMDAITLTTARLVGSAQLDAATGWRVILVASMSNLVFKGATVAVLGPAALRRQVAVLFGIALAFGGLVLLLWPG